MRTSQFTLALVVTLLVAATSLGASVGVSATRSHPYDYDDQITEWAVAVWQPGNYNWDCSVYADVMVEIRGNPSGCSVTAEALAKVVTPNGDVKAEIGRSLSGANGRLSADDDDWDSDSVSMDEPGIVLTFREDVWASATVGNFDPDALARGQASASASGSVW